MSTGRDAPTRIPSHQQKATIMTATLLVASVGAPSVDIDALCALKTTDEQGAFEDAFQRADAENYVVNADGSETWLNRVFDDGELPSKPLHIDAALAAIRSRLNEDEGPCEAEPFELRDEGDRYVAVAYMHSCILHYSDGSTRDF